LPEDIGNAKAGSPCPNNPFERESELVAELESERSLLDLAGYLSDLAELHLVDVARTTAEEWTVIHIMMERNEYRQMQAMQSGMMRVVHVTPDRRIADADRAQV
jgi:hypothetical protein